MEGTAEIDSPLEGDGFEPLVPPWREAAVSTPLTAPFARSHTRNDKPPSASGPGVRIRFAPAERVCKLSVPGVVHGIWARYARPLPTSLPANRLQRTRRI